MDRKFNPGFISLIIIVISLVMFSSAHSQDKKKTIRVSPKAEVMQTIGFTDVRISYSRPGVKGRKIWDGLVPYNKVWRAGANEATKFTFSTDVKVNGKVLKAGSYSFFVIPNENEWTVIFNKVADQWGAFEYNEAEDALRFTAVPEKGNFTEWLEYKFSKIDDTSAYVSLNWENLSLKFKVVGSDK